MQAQDVTGGLWAFWLCRLEIQLLCVIEVKLTFNPLESDVQASGQPAIHPYT